jgi:hypothetical protein
MISSDSWLEQRMEGFRVTVAINEVRHSSRSILSDAPRSSTGSRARFCDFHALAQPRASLSFIA